MKSLLAALVAASVLIPAVSGSAAEAPLMLRGVGVTEPATGGAQTTVATASTEAAPARKVRVVLGSPYGN